MQTNELRIGNLIYWDIPEKKEVVHEVVGIRNQTPQTTPISLGESINDYQPIPLTEEWLLRFGFSKEHSSVRENEYWSNGATLGLIKISGFYYHDFIAVTSVHQLQNLYFALTGEELTIKTNIENA